MRITLVLVYLVIVAGAVVRMTGSGMGCPDWPKCFGHIIPPTERAELEWHPDQKYESGQVIIKDKQLFTAERDFTSSKNFKADKWEVYTKHDYASFNPTHTWTEYVNRLMGALAGLSVFIMAVLSFFRKDPRKRIVALSWIAVFLMGFQAWLGAKVVYSVLEPVKITIHMVTALGIVALILIILFSIRKQESHHLIIPSRAKGLGIVLLVATLVQIILGTQVRQFIDHQMDVLGAENPGKWLLPEPTIYLVHRSFSIIIVLLTGLSYWQSRRYKLQLSSIKWVVSLVLLAVITGVVMAYAAFPFTSQPLHLVIASALFGVLFYWVLQLFADNFKNWKSEHASS